MLAIGHELTTGVTSTGVDQKQTMKYQIIAKIGINLHKE